jgi:hypothetical protein
MIKALKITMCFVVLAVGAQAFAGVGSSGGGPSVYCPGASDPAGVAQLYDFFEGRLRRGFNIAVTNSITNEDQAEFALKKLEVVDYVVAQDVREKYKALKAKINYLPAGIFMGPVVDLGTGEPALIPADCQLQYAGYFESSGQVSVSRLLYDDFTETEKAALLIHEALYAVARDMTHQSDSESTRVVNAFLFSTEKIPSSQVQDALRSMRMPAFKLVIPVLLTHGDRRLVFRTSCADAASSEDFVAWDVRATFWNESGGLESDQGLSLYINEKTIPDAHTFLEFSPTTKSISFDQGLNGHYSVGGKCSKTQIDVIYDQKKIGSISDDIPNFLVKIYE